MTSQSAEHPLPHDGSRIGCGAHRAIALLLRKGLREPTSAEILATVESDPALEQPHVYRLAARQRLVAACAVYFRFFLPDPRWRFVDAEVSAGHSLLDLLFEDQATRRLGADELKTGAAPALVDPEELEVQVSTQLRGGTARFGGRFAGVRVIFLAAPGRSFVVASDGTARPLRDGTW